MYKKHTIMDKLTFTPGQIAQTAHGAYKGFSEATGSFHRKDFAEVSAEDKEIMVELVEFILDNPKVDPIEVHEKWCQLMEDAGWEYRVRPRLDENGEPELDEDEDVIMDVFPFNPVRKINPLITDWENLPPERRLKNALLIHLVQFFALEPEEPKEKKAPAKKAAPKKEEPEDKPE